MQVYVLSDELPGKEMFHAQVLLHIPCYDLLPVNSVTVVPPPHPCDVRSCFTSSCVNCFKFIARVRGKGASGTPVSHELTGGEYKTQEHIHRSIADLRLLAIPTSCRRVAAGNPN